MDRTWKLESRYLIDVLFNLRTVYLTAKVSAYFRTIWRQIVMVCRSSVLKSYNTYFAIMQKMFRPYLKNDILDKQSKKDITYASIKRVYISISF